MIREHSASEGGPTGTPGRGVGRGKCLAEVQTVLPVPCPGVGGGVLGVSQGFSGESYRNSAGYPQAINPESLFIYLSIFEVVFNMLSVKGSGIETLAQSPWVPDIRQRQENENTKLVVSTGGHRAPEAPPPLSAHTPSPLPPQPPVFTLLSDSSHPGLSN